MHVTHNGNLNIVVASKTDSILRLVANNTQIYCFYFQNSNTFELTTVEQIRTNDNIKIRTNACPS